MIVVWELTILLRSSLHVHTELRLSSCTSPACDSFLGCVEDEMFPNFGLFCFMLAWLQRPPCCCFLFCSQSLVLKLLSVDRSVGKSETSHSVRSLGNSETPFSETLHTTGYTHDDVTGDYLLTKETPTLNGLHLIKCLSESKYN